MVRVLDFSDGYENANPPGTVAVTKTGSSSAPVLITAAGGITPAVAFEEDQYVAGDGGVPIDITAVPQIAAGTFDGQILNVIGTSDSATVLLENGNGLQMNGPATLTNAAEVSFRWNATASVWRERYRNGMA